MLVLTTDAHRRSRFAHRRSARMGVESGRQGTYPLPSGRGIGGGRPQNFDFHCLFLDTYSSRQTDKYLASFQSTLQPAGRSYRLQA